MKTCDETSQMKGESVVVAVTDNNNKPFREHDFRKGQTPGGPNACKVYIPFNTEYKIFLKNQNGCRIKVEAELDGTNITDSGLVIGGNTSVHLERFLGGEGKKFLFVPVENDAVGDPTSKENGVLRIKVFKEKPVEIKKIIEEHHHHNHYHDYWYRRGWGWPYGTSDWTLTCSNDRGYTIYGSNNSAKNIMPGPGDTIGSAGDIGAVNCFFSQTSSEPVAAASCSYSSDTLDAPTVSDLNVKSGAIGQAGATVEGSKSDQKFFDTTWNGDTGVAYTFVFKLLGVSGELSEKEKKEWEEYKRLKEKFGDK